MQRLLEISDGQLIRELCGINDSNIDFLEKKLNISINLRPQGLLIKGNKDPLLCTEKIIKKCLSLAKKGIILNQEEILRSFPEIDSHQESDIKKIEKIKVSAKKGYISARTDGQSKYMAAVDEYDITFTIGPAGTGKTYLAVAMAVRYLQEKKIQRIILTRPAIEAGESLGFLPGDLSQKLGPYMRPLYDALYDMIDINTIEDYLETGIIEIAPLGFMRGRTLNNAFIILDEAQNCTAEQLKMFLTRLGFNSKTVITGDVTQSDLPGGKPMGLLDVLSFVKKIRGIKLISLTNKDVVRHPLVQKIIKAYDEFYKQRSK